LIELVILLECYLLECKEVAVLGSSAYLLVSHGSRDPRPQIAMEHLAQLIADRQTRAGGWHGSIKSPLVGTAVLELAPFPLHQQIQQFADRAIEQGYEILEIVPIFLLPGVHVMEDIPAEVQQAQQSLQTKITLVIRPHLGADPNLGKNLGKLLLNPVTPEVTAITTGRILLSHGSRRPNSHQAVESIADALGALPAYWSVPPNLETQVIAQVKQGYQHIAILPYFLFEGGITDAIGQEVERLKQQFPYVQFHLARSIGATPALADLLLARLMPIPH
jgi:sirohydrochlorin ferrochelatase